MTLTQKQTKNLLFHIRKNKKYQSISEDIINQEIRRYFKTNPKHIKFLDKQKSKKFKKIVREIRAKLHLIYGSFQTKNKEKREVYLKNKEFDKILGTSISSKERLKDYKKLYSNIFKITGKPNVILDLGCGLNPVSYKYMNLKSLKYYAYDIDKDDINFLNKYFSLIKDKLDGKAYVKDLSSIDVIKKLPKADICFMFKLLDPLEKGKGHKLSEEIITSLNCKYIVVSFSTKTVSGKPMKHPYRGWIERMLNRINLKFKKISLENEIFYIVKNKPKL